MCIRDRDECDNMENKVSDNVIEKNYRECLKFNEINESKVDNFDLAIAKAALATVSYTHLYLFLKAPKNKLQTVSSIPW